MTVRMASAEFSPRPGNTVTTGPYGHVWWPVAMATRLPLPGIERTSRSPIGRGRCCLNRASAIEPSGWTVQMACTSEKYRSWYSQRV